MNILSCTSCRSGGYVGIRPCPECHGLATGRLAGDVFLYYGEPITRYHIALRRVRRWLTYFEVIGCIVFLFGFLAAFAFRAYAAGVFGLLPTIQFWFGPYGGITRYAYLAGLALLYLIYRLLATNRPPQELWCPAPEAEPRPPAGRLTWTEAVLTPRKKKKDISRMTSGEAKIAIERAYRLAEKYRSEFVLPEHMFHALLDIVEIRNIFIRLGIDPATLQARIADAFPKADIARTPYLAPVAQTALFRAHDIACGAGEDRVQAVDLLVAAHEASERLKDILLDAAVDNKKLANVVSWIRVRTRLRISYSAFRRAAAHRSKYGIDRAMTAVSTPYLNAFSQDVTLAAKFGYLAPCLARDKEIADIFRIIEGGRQNVILVGPAGIGKMSVIEGIAERMVEERVPKRLQDKRLVQLSTSALLAGTTVSGAQERLIHMMREIRKAGNIILFIHNIHDLVSVNAMQGQTGMDVSGSLAEFLSSRDVVMLATATLDGYNRHIVNAELGTAFARVDIPEMDESQAIAVLEGKVGGIEYKQSVYFSYDALEAAVQLAQRFLREEFLPESAIELATEAAALARAKRGEHAFVARDDVAAVVSQKTGVPAASITSEESEKLLRLEEVMHERLVGQDEAVTLVANALRRARTEIRSAKRPIATFLFLGPTGVGKTELAKTIAEVYFGGEDRMLRLDMSEFQDTESIYRLIGKPGEQGTGLLTEPVRQRPFSLVLFDELEKADANVLNLFLQVFDDGRLTDSVGRVIDFTNAIIIATSNAGTGFVQEQLAQGKTQNAIRDALVHTELAQYYRPEFLNRFDAIVLFRALERTEIKQIAGLMLKRVAKNLDEKGIALRVEEGALFALADAGWDATFGARPMRRAIQDHVEDAIAQLLLAGKLARRDTVVLGDGMSIRVEKKAR